MNLDVVIVTFNRLEKLKKTLDSYEKQTASFRNIIIVNNNSTDGTHDFLEEWKKESCVKFSKHVIHLPENIGGSGGFYTGQKFAISLKPDWIFLADDDAYPEPDMIDGFYSYTKEHELAGISAICATVLNPDKSICLYHRSKVVLKKCGLIFSMESSKIEDYEKPFQIDLLSYVGSFIKMESLESVGLVNKDYFIYADDAEHSLRLRQVGKIVCVPSIKILHDSGQDTSKVQDVTSWRDYYAERNFVNMLKRHYIFTLPFKLIDLWRTTRTITSPRARALYKAAVKDGITNKLGIHPTYKPGWSNSNK